MEQKKFKLADRVYKPNGYRFTSIIVSVFRKTTGEVRYVAENRDGILHIFSASQLKLKSKRPPE